MQQVLLECGDDAVGLVLVHNCGLWRVVPCAVSLLAWMAMSSVRYHCGFCAIGTDTETVTRLPL